MRKVNDMETVNLTIPNSKIEANMHYEFIHEEISDKECQGYDSYVILHNVYICDVDIFDLLNDKQIEQIEREIMKLL